MKYFDGCARAYGIQIKRTWQCDSATELKVLRKRKGGFQPPQSYRYVRPGEFQRLLA